MKTIDLYLRILNDVRYNILSDTGHLSDYEVDSDSYKLLDKVNTACNTLSDLINIIKYEIDK